MHLDRAAVALTAGCRAFPRRPAAGAEQLESPGVSGCSGNVGCGSGKPTVRRASERAGRGRRCHGQPRAGRRATALAGREGGADRVRFVSADAMTPPFPTPRSMPCGRRSARSADGSQRGGHTAPRAAHFSRAPIARCAASTASPCPLYRPRCHFHDTTMWPGATVPTGSAPRIGPASDARLLPGSVCATLREAAGSEGVSLSFGSGQHLQTPPTRWQGPVRDFGGLPPGPAPAGHCGGPSGAVCPPWLSWPIHFSSAISRWRQGSAKTDRTG